MEHLDMPHLHNSLHFSQDRKSKKSPNPVIHDVSESDPPIADSGSI